MKLNSKLTGGLAWAGLIVVLAVPSADLLMGKKDGDSVKTVTPVESTTPAITAPAVVAPASTAAEAPVKPLSVRTIAIDKDGDPVETFVQSGKKLPSYISDAPTDQASAKPTTTPTLVVPGVPGSVKPVENPEPTTDVALAPTFDDTLVAPTPYPASKRPRPGINRPVTEVATTTPTVKPVTVAPITTVDPVTTATAEQPLIVDETTIQKRDEAVAAVLDDEDEQFTVTPNRVESDQLEEWDSGSLADYLEKKGLMTNRAQATNDDTTDFDEDGFFLDQGPNNSEARVVRRIKPRNNFQLF